jgi:hypothetical protein
MRSSFCFRTMHDVSLSLTVRMDAAGKLMKMGVGNYKEQHIHITIRGGMPRKRRLEDFCPEMQRDLLWIKWCYENGMLVPRHRQLGD